MPEPSPTAAATLKPELVALLSEQSGIVSRGQLAAVGVSSSTVRDQVRARRWRALGLVLVAHRGPLTREQRWWVAVLHAGQRAALAGLSALEAAGLRGWSRDEVHVVVRRGSRIRALPWMAVHESRRFDPVTDLATASGVPRTGPARAAIDAAAWSTSPRTAAGLVAAVVQQRLVTAATLEDALLAAGQVRRRRLIAASIADVAGGAQSLAEIDAARLIRRAGLPRPRRQVVRRDAAGRRRYLDLEVDLPDGRILVVEVDGAVHLDPRTWVEDQLRQNEVALDGRVVVRFPAAMVRTEPERLIAQLAPLAANPSS